jgi:rhomboid protease GluP
MSLFALFHSPSRHKCEEFNLVLQAVNLESQVVAYEGRFYLLVSDHIAESAYLQLKGYVNENTPEEIITKPLLPFSKGFIGAYLYAVILLVFGVLQSTGTFNLDWHQTGLADSWKIAGGEWWRAITALTIHADIAHLAGNIGFGALFGLLVSQHIGSAAAWLTILLSGAGGNLINAYFYKSLHLSLGASTMVFAALGILGIFSLNAKSVYRQGSMRRWLPFITTVALLALTGTAGERTDVLAHLSGFLSGCASGLIWAGFGKPQISDKNQQVVLGVLIFLTIITAWTLAIANA